MDNIEEDVTTSNPMEIILYLAEQQIEELTSKFVVNKIYNNKFIIMTILTFG
jgi:hypothetical protein